MRLIIRGQIGDNSSYDFHSRIIIDGLLERGYELCIIPMNQDAWTRRIPEKYDSRLARQPTIDAPTLVIYPPKYLPDDPQRTIYSTMWETTRIPDPWVRNLNVSKAVIIPSMSNIIALSGQGVTAPMHQVPFGIDVDAFQPSKPKERPYVVFGTSGISKHGWPRKGFDEVVEAFQEAFPRGNEPVELRIKCYPKDPLPGFSDSRIAIDQGTWPKDKLADWYKSIDVYVCMSKGEGWGLMPAEAAACGRPSVLPIFFGFSDHITQEMSFPVDYKLVSATDSYEGMGLWAEPDVMHCAAVMRDIVTNREMLIKKGQKSYRQARQFTYNRMVDGYVEVIRETFKGTKYGY